MANKIKGEVVLGTVEHDDGNGTTRSVTYTLVYDINALIDLEDALGMPLTELLEKPQLMSRLGTIRTMIRVGLRAKHGEITDHEAGDIMQAIGLDNLDAKMGEAMNAAMPSDKGGPAGGGKPRPQPGKPGTGKRS